MNSSRKFPSGASRTPRVRKPVVGVICLMGTRADVAWLIRDTRDSLEMVLSMMGMAFVVQRHEML